MDHRVVEYKREDAWKYLGFVGASVNTSASLDATMLQVTALTPLFTSALSRAAPMFTVRSLEGKDLDDARTRNAATRARATEDPSAVARDAAFESVFPPPHPYALPVTGERARLGQATEKEEELIAADRPGSAGRRRGAQPRFDHARRRPRGPLRRAGARSRAHVPRAHRRAAEVGHPPLPCAGSRRAAGGRRRRRCRGARLELGYCDQSHFIRDFESQVGRTPSAYEKHCAARRGATA